MSYQRCVGKQSLYLGVNIMFKLALSIVAFVVTIIVFNLIAGSEAAEWVTLGFMVAAAIAVYNSLMAVKASGEF